MPCTEPQKRLMMNLRALMMDQISPDRVQPFLNIYDDYADLIDTIPGSAHNHQAWPGGFKDHMAEILRVNAITYAALNALRPLPFTLSSAAIALFLHDIEKPFKYGPATDPRCIPWQSRFTTSDQWEEAKWDIIAVLEPRYGFALTDEERNAIKYTHGEGADHRKDMCVSTPLAAHVHHCDNTSARIYPNDGRGLG